MKKNLIITLIIGLVVGGSIGFYSAGRLAKNRIDKMRKIAHEPGSEQKWLMKKLGLSEEQRREIAPILKEEMPKQREMIIGHREALDSMREEMFSKLKPFLNEDQIDEISHMKERHMHRHR